LLQNKSTISTKIKQCSTFSTWRHLKAHMNTDTNLSDVYWHFTHSRADASQLGLCLGNGLPQLRPAPVCMVDLPPVDLEALLLQLQQHPVPGGVRFSDLIPYHLKRQKKTHLSSSRRPCVCAQPSNMSNVKKPSGTRGRGLH
jgi:hypothetical protein